MSADTTNLELACKVSQCCKRRGAELEKASPLVSSAAMQIGFARIAVGMARWSNEPNGHGEMQTRLANEQFDILNLAPINYASQTVMTCLDLCAAAAYRLRDSGNGGKPVKPGQESDLRNLQTRTGHPRDPVVLRKHQAAWLQQVLTDSRLAVLEDARHNLIHRSFGSHSWVPANTTEFMLDGKEYPILQLAIDFTDFAQNSFEALVAAIQADYP
ncbi:hypothetical protein ACFTWF_32680 [Rhodococcus sp. NPDC056960]|uniref:hypothetical protein n=1 Tax=Rhodococcus sp. NPDC056960 TaxID=3345982 RepID=UPI003628DFEC